jgi:hypothetical protein
MHERAAAAAAEGHRRRTNAARLIVAVALTTALSMHERLGRGLASQATLSEPARFHHLHLVAPSPTWIANYYASLFVPSKVTRGVFWGLEGVQGTEAYLLVSRPHAERRSNDDTAIWHFGWGAVSVGETYKRHFVREVNWRPPYPGLEADFHVHLRSRDPLGAGRWYREVLGGVLEEGAPLDRGQPEDERADALVRFHNVLLVLHRWSGPLVSSETSGPVDHLAFLVRNPDAIRDAARRPRASGAASDAVTAGYPLEATPTVSIEGPDRIAIELLPAARGPAFWR